MLEFIGNQWHKIQGCFSPSVIDLISIVLVTNDCILKVMYCTCIANASIHWAGLNFDNVGTWTGNWSLRAVRFWRWRLCPYWSEAEQSAPQHSQLWSANSRMNILARGWCSAVWAREWKELEMLSSKKRKEQSQKKKVYFAPVCWVCCDVAYDW